MRGAAFSYDRLWHALDLILPRRYVVAHGEGKVDIEYTRERGSAGDLSVTLEAVELDGTTDVDTAPPVSSYAEASEIEAPNESTLSWAEGEEGTKTFTVTLRGAEFHGTKRFAVRVADFSLSTASSTLPPQEAEPHTSLTQGDGRPLALFGQHQLSDRHLALVDVVGGGRRARTMVAAAPTLTCRSTGDPHYTTFEGSYYDYYGTCEHVMVLLRDDSGNDLLRIHSYHEPLGSASGNTKLFIRAKVPAACLSPNGDAAGCDSAGEVAGEEVTATVDGATRACTIDGLGTTCATGGDFHLVISSARFGSHWPVDGNVVVRGRFFGGKFLNAYVDLPSTGLRHNATTTGLCGEIGTGQLIRNGHEFGASFRLGSNAVPLSKRLSSDASECQYPNNPPPTLSPPVSPRNRRLAEAKCRMQPGDFDECYKREIGGGGGGTTGGGGGGGGGTTGGGGDDDDKLLEAELACINVRNGPARDACVFDYRVA